MNVYIISIDDGDDEIVIADDFKQAATNYVDYINADIDDTSDEQPFEPYTVADITRLERIGPVALMCPSQTVTQPWDSDVEDDEDDESVPL